jgi:hypothetical protein
MTLLIDKWIEQDKYVQNFEASLPFPKWDLSDVPSLLVKHQEDLKSLPKGGGCYWIWTDEPVWHKLHKEKEIPKKVKYSTKDGAIVYNGIAKDNVKARLMHHLFGDPNQGWSGISMDILKYDAQSHAKKAMSTNGKSKVAMLLNGTPIRDIDTLLDNLHLSEDEKNYIYQHSETDIYFRNGINVTEEKHKNFDFVVFYITGLKSKSYLEYIEKKWRDEYKLPQLCSYKSGR